MGKAFYDRSKETQAVCIPTDRKTFPVIYDKNKAQIGNTEFTEREVVEKLAIENYFIFK